MQTLVTKLVTKKINGVTSHIKRIIMSQDEDDNPAEIFGSDGKIFYRRAGEPETELGGGNWILNPDPRTDHILFEEVPEIMIGDEEILSMNTTNAMITTTEENDLMFEVVAGKSFVFRTRPPVTP